MVGFTLGAPRGVAFHGMRFGSLRRPAAGDGPASGGHKTHWSRNDTCRGLCQPKYPRNRPARSRWRLRFTARAHGGVKSETEGRVGAEKRLQLRREQSAPLLELHDRLLQWKNQLLSSIPWPRPSTMLWGNGTN